MTEHGFYPRLQVKIGRDLLTKDRTVLTTSLDRRNVTIKSRDGGKLSETRWIVLEAHGFATKGEARIFGEKLRTNVQLAGLCSNLGTDTGQDTVLTEFAEKHLAGWRWEPSVHGLSVIADDGKARFAYMEARATGILPPEHLLSAMEEFAQQSLLEDPILLLSVRLLNLAFVNPEWLARVVLAIAAVEALAKDEEWNEEQSRILHKLAAETQDPEVKEAIQRLHMHKIGVRQGIKRVLREHKLEHLQGEWDSLYNLRSALFHGGKQLSKEEQGELQGAISFCARIVLRVLKQKGFTLPHIANMHFGDI